MRLKNLSDGFADLCLLLLDRVRGDDLSIDYTAEIRGEINKYRALRPDVGASERAIVLDSLRAANIVAACGLDTDDLPAVLQAGLMAQCEAKS